MTVATLIAVVAAAAAVAALVATTLVARKSRARQMTLEAETERAKAAFDAVVAQEVERRSTELASTLARARADSLSALAEEERRIAEERRRDVAERERDAGVRLGEQLITVQHAVEQRLTGWASDVEKLQEGLTEELHRIEARQRHLMTEIESRIGQDADGLQSQIDEQKQLISKLRTELLQAAQSVTQQAAADLEQHAAERRKALHDIAERLRKRETALKELVEREGNDAAQRVQLAMGDIERRQIEQLQRIVNRETTRYSEAAAAQFDTAARGSREEAARRLSRELDLAVERFAREAEGVLSERVNHVSDVAAQRVEDRLARLRGALERQRDEAITSLEDRAHQVAAALRDRLDEIATDAEAGRSVLEIRLQDLARKVDELTSRF